MIIDLRIEGKAELREPLVPGGIEVHACLFPDGKTHQIGLKPLDAFIDTGASRSCIPRALCRGSNGLPIPRVVDIQNALDWRGDHVAESTARAPVAQLFPERRSLPKASRLRRARSLYSLEVTA